jgi:peptidoglycan hydrolase-like protein with peptidoglycan-binding domain
VYVLQGLLYAAGYDPGGLDGTFGTNTLAAVKKFQAAKGLTVDGEAGADTFGALLA